VTERKGLRGTKKRPFADAQGDREGGLRATKREVSGGQKRGPSLTLRATEKGASG